MRSPFKDSHKVLHEDIASHRLELNKLHRHKARGEEFYFLKAHEKHIALIMKVKMEIEATLSISVDGYVRLWSAKKECLFSLKIPALVKVVWNMKEIEKVKNDKSISELLDIFEKHFRNLIEKKSPYQLVQRAKRQRKEPETKKLNINHPIPIDF